MKRGPMTPTPKLLGALSLALLSTACVTERVVYRDVGPRPYMPPPPPAYQPPPPQAVVSLYVEPPIGQPAAIGCPWAPPPMLVEAPPPPPFEGAIWTGGYWVWHDTWVWAHGRWAAPPRAEYRWHPPYYENRDGMVVFITGHWGAPGVIFVPPPPSIRITLEVGGPGVIPGPRPLGPPGVFVPPPPGSRVGIIVPAPIGTAPSVVTSAPPVINVGMRITNNVNSGNTKNTTNINNNRTTIVNNVTNVTNVTIVAPPSATASGHAVNTSVPAQAHLAAAMPAVVRTPAPMPSSAKAVPAFTHGQAPVALPPPQPVRPAPTPVTPPRVAPAAPTQPRPAPPASSPQVAPSRASSPVAPPLTTTASAPIAPRPNPEARPVQSSAPDRRNPPLARDDERPRRPAEPAEARPSRPSAPAAKAPERAKPREENTQLKKDNKEVKKTHERERD